jgi:hypothetical protein
MRPSILGTTNPAGRREVSNRPFEFGLAHLAPIALAPYILSAASAEASGSAQLRRAAGICS